MEMKPNCIDFLEFPAQTNRTVEEARAFYSDVFGWTFKTWSDHYVDTSDSGLPSGFNAHPEHGPAKPLAVIYSTNLTAARDNVVNAGGTLTKEIFAFPGGRRFHFLDPAGNELAVWSDK